MFTGETDGIYILSKHLNANDNNAIMQVSLSFHNLMSKIESAGEEYRHLYRIYNMDQSGKLKILYKNDKYVDKENDPDYKKYLILKNKFEE